RVGVLAYGSSHLGTTEARDLLVKEHGIALDYCRLRALPLGDETKEWIARHQRIYVVEQNRDGQLLTILREELPELATRFVSIRQYNGLPLDATTVVEGVLADRGERAGQNPPATMTEEGTLVEGSRPTMPGFTIQALSSSTTAGVN
ncbi:MAG TPA: hypothetical protein VKF32_06545, partial [Thermoanaerobaculia bacterium]|nr:hypothetical protein [Thermoanaerobaculia bacterium]